MSDYAVKVTIRNGRILAKMQEAGISSQAELARLCGLSTVRVNALVCIRRAGKNSNGEWPVDVWAMSSALNCEPEDLFTDAQANSSLKHNTKELMLGEQEVKSLFSEQSLEDDVFIRGTIDKLFLDLKPRERTVVEARMAGVTLDEIGDDLGITRSRAQQIECTAHRKMKTAYHRFDKNLPFAQMRLDSAA